MAESAHEIPMLLHAKCTDLIWRHLIRVLFAEVGPRQLLHCKDVRLLFVGSELGIVNAAGMSRSSALTMQV